MTGGTVTAERFHEVFRAAITLKSFGYPATWEAHSPIAMARGSSEPQFEREFVATGSTPEEAITNLVARAVETVRDRLTEARSKLAHAEEAVHRIEAAAIEMGQ
jgi:hypothetical protein